MHCVTYYYLEKVEVKCNQTGEHFFAKLEALSREDTMQITMEELNEGAQLLMKHNKKSYPVTILKIDSTKTDKSKAYRLRSC